MSKKEHVRKEEVVNHIVGHLTDDWGTKVEIIGREDDKILVAPFTIDHSYPTNEPYVLYSGKTRIVAPERVRDIHREEIK